MPPEMPEMARRGPEENSIIDQAIKSLSGIREIIFDLGNSIRKRFEEEKKGEVKLDEAKINKIEDLSRSLNKILSSIVEEIINQAPVEHQNNLRQIWEKEKYILDPIMVRLPKEIEDVTLSTRSIAYNIGDVNEILDYCKQAGIDIVTVLQKIIELNVSRLDTSVQNFDQLLDNTITILENIIKGMPQITGQKISEQIQKEPVKQIEEESRQLTPKERRRKMESEILNKRLESLLTNASELAKLLDRIKNLQSNIEQSAANFDAQKIQNVSEIVGNLDTEVIESMDKLNELLENLERLSSSSNQ